MAEGSLEFVQCLARVSNSLHVVVAVVRTIPLLPFLKQQLLSDIYVIVSRNGAIAKAFSFVFM